MICFLLLTACAVSIDSFFCGFSLGNSCKNKFLLVFVITITVLLMCVATNYLALLFTNFLNEKTASFGGIILIGIGIYNLFKKDSPVKKNKSEIVQYLLAGFAVGLDGAFANLSLSIMGINAFYVPIVIAIMHAVMIYLGSVFSSIKFLKNSGTFAFLPPILLICLGLYKLVGVFI